MARYLVGEFTCAFAMSDPSLLVQHELHRMGMPWLRTPSRPQFYPDDSRSRAPWSDDLSSSLGDGDVLVLDGYRFDVTFVEAAHRNGARVIQVVDELVALEGVDAVITSLPIAHRVAVDHGLPDAIWTGEDGFLLRPEFYSPWDPVGETQWDWFVYVSNARAMESLRAYPHLKGVSTLALTTMDWEDACRDCGWDVMVDPPVEELVRNMRLCKQAQLPASTTAIEFLVATGRKPHVTALAANQHRAFALFSERGFWLGESSGQEIGEVPIHASSPQSKFISWIHGRI